MGRRPGHPSDGGGLVNFSSLNPYVHSLQAQASAVMHTIAAVTANAPQPARTTVIYTIVLIFILLALLKITKKASK